MEHLSEERLLEIADGGLEDPHLRDCPQCARAVDEQRAARAALQAAPLLELPRERVHGFVAALPEQTRVRRLRGWPRRVAILAPVAAAAIAILVSGRGADERPVAEGAGAEDATALSAPAPAQEDARTSAPQLEALPPQAKRACPAPDASLQTPIAEVQGPPQAVVEILRAAGIEAAQCNEAVEVYGARAADAALKALEGRPDGDVEVRTAR